MAEVKRDYAKMMNMFQSTAPETQTTTSGEHIDRENGCVELSISMLEHFPQHPFELYTGVFTPFFIKLFIKIPPILILNIDYARLQVYLYRYTNILSLFQYFHVRAMLVSALSAYLFSVHYTP